MDLFFLSHHGTDALTRSITIIALSHSPKYLADLLELVELVEHYLRPVDLHSPEHCWWTRFQAP